MRTYSSKQELIGVIRDSYEKYDTEFAVLNDADRDVRVEGVDKTPAENIAYQIGWLTLLLGWERDEKEGRDAQVPTKGYKWNNLGGLCEHFYHEYHLSSLQEQQDVLRALVDELCMFIENLSDSEIFEPGARKWAETSARWPIYKWVHINSVAPFTNFGAKLRNWKRVVTKRR